MRSSKEVGGPGGAAASEDDAAAIDTDISAANYYSATSAALCTEARGAAPRVCVTMLGRSRLLVNKRWPFPRDIADFADSTPKGRCGPLWAPHCRRNRKGPGQGPSRGLVIFTNCSRTVYYEPWRVSAICKQVRQVLVLSVPVSMTTFSIYSCSLFPLIPVMSIEKDGDRWHPHLSSTVSKHRDDQRQRSPGISDGILDNPCILLTLCL